MPALIDVSSSIDTNVYLGWGIHSTKAATALPASTQGVLFTVTGGAVIVNLLMGRVTTLIQSQACATKIILDPTVGSDVDACATADINALELGGHFIVTGVVASAALIPLGGGGGSLHVAAFLVEPGTIDLNTAATNTGAFKWDIFWVPFDSGASLA